MEPAETQFRNAAALRGLMLPEDPKVGVLDRCPIKDSAKGTKDGAYIFHADGCPAGGFENHKDGFGWVDWSAHLDRPMTSEERSNHLSRVEQARKLREDEDARLKAAAAERAEKIWAEATPCESHHYLTRKGVQSYGLRSSGDDLLVPLFTASGKLSSYQTITANGTKRFLKDGRKQGCFFTLGTPGDGLIYVGEGYATCATTHEASGDPVVVAFDAGNLLFVAKAMRQMHPKADIVMVADDDQTPGNPGLTKAQEAAAAVGGRVVLPDWGDDRPEGATDFNDLAQHRGLDAVRVCLVAPPVETEPAPWVHPTLPLEVVEARSPWILGDVARMLREDPPPVRWLVEGLIPAGQQGLFAARAGAGKSMTSLLVALGLASGRGVLGRPVSPDAARGVLYVGMEDDQAEFWRRLQNGVALMREEPGWSSRDEDSIAARLVPMFPDRLVCGDFRLETQWKCLQVQADAIPGGCGLIVLDTFARLSGGDENSAKETRPFLEAQAGLAQATGATVMAIHHVGKGNDAPSAKKLWERLHPEALRGSSAIEASARFILTMACLSPSEAERTGLDLEHALAGGYVALHLAKMSQGEKGSTILLERRKGGQPGAGFLCPHPDSEHVLAVIQGESAVLKLNLRDKVLGAIAEAGSLNKIDQAAEAQQYWPDAKNPLGQWQKQLVDLRKRGWLTDLHLTGAGIAHAESLGFISSARKLEKATRTEEHHMGYGLPPGSGETEVVEVVEEMSTSVLPSPDRGTEVEVFPQTLLRIDGRVAV